MRKYYILFVGVLLVFATSGFSQTITNPSFETGSPGSFTGWTDTVNSGSPSAASAVGDANVKDGSEAWRYFSTEPFSVTTAQTAAGISAGLYHLKMHVSVPYGGSPIIFTLAADGGSGPSSQSTTVNHSQGYRSLMLHNVEVTAAGNLQISITQEATQSTGGNQGFVDLVELIPAVSGLQNGGLDSGDYVNGLDYWNVAVTDGTGFPENGSLSVRSGTNAARFYAPAGAPFGGNVSQGVSGLTAGIYQVKAHFAQPWGGAGTAYTLRVDGGAGEKSEVMYIDHSGGGEPPYEPLLVQNVVVDSNGLLDINIDINSPDGGGTSTFVDDVELIGPISVSDVQNGDMESGDSEAGWDFWSTYVLAGVAFNADGTINAHGGSQSLRWYAGGSGVELGAAQTIYGVAADDYIASVWVAAPWGGDATFTLRVDGGVGEASNSLNLVLTDSYEELTVPVSVTGAGEISVRIDVSAEVGNIFIDDFTLVVDSAVQDWQQY